MSRLHIQTMMHVPFEGPGHIGEWAKARGHRLSETHLFDGAAPLACDAFDWLLVMGGPMGANDDNQYPWMPAEKAAIRAAIDAGKPVIGVCLGAQLIADVMGARVFPNAEKEIGWFPVTSATSNTPCFGHMPASLPVLHWHGDTFNLPDGAQHLFRSDGCENQGFVLNDRVFGFQFHFETTPAGCDALLQNCRDELSTGQFIQSETEIRAQKRNFSRMHAVLDTFLDNLASIA
jgi:GMP synthase-like glutamine amidotransferase